jgi:hypothetical protein
MLAPSPRIFASMSHQLSHPRLHSEIVTRGHAAHHAEIHVAAKESATATIR